MNRKQAIVHLVSLVAIMMGLFSPLLSQPVLADDAPVPDPVVTTSGDFGTPQPRDESGGAVPVIELIEVVPVMPTLTSLDCTDGGIYAQSATEVATEGVIYSIGAPDATGAFVVTATLTDATVYQWAASGLDGWGVSGDTATAVGTLELCPVPNPIDDGQDAGETGDADASTPDASEPASEIESLKPAAGTPDALNASEPTTGRGPARDTGMTVMSRTPGEISIGISASPEFDVIAGTEITYTITVTNDTATGQNYTLQDVLPTGVTYVSHTVPYPLDGDTCTPGVGVVDCALANEMMVLYPGWSDVWTITVSVNADAANSTTCKTGLVNTVTGTGTGTGSWGDSATVTSMFRDDLCEPALSITMVADTPIITRNDQQVSFTVTITNTSTIAATGVETEVHLYSMFMLGNWDASSTSTTGSCVLSGAHADCTNLTIPGRVGTTNGEVVITTSLPAGTAYPPANCATYGLWAHIVHASIEEPLRAETDQTIVCDVRFMAEVTANKTSVSPGEGFEYTVTVTSVGNGTYLEQSSRLLFGFPTPSGSSYYFPHAAPVYSSNLNCNIGNQPSQSCSLPASMTISPGDVMHATYQLAVATNPSPVACENGLQSSVNFYNISGLWTWENTPQPPVVLFDCDAGFELSASVSPGIIPVGGNIYYEVTFESGDVPTATEGPYSFAIALPPGFEFVAIYDRCVLGNVDGSVTATCTLDEIGPGYLSSMTMPITIDSQDAAQYCAGKAEDELVNVTSTTTAGIGTGWNPAHRTANVDINIQCNSRHSFSMTADKQVVSPGEQFVVTYSITNSTGEVVSASISGSVDLQSMEQVDIVPSHGLGCILLVNTEFVYCSTNNSLPGSPWSFGYVFEVDEVPTDETCQNGITTRMEQEDGAWVTDVSRNQSVTVQVNCQELEISQQVSEPSVLVGDPFDYTITVTNNGFNSHGSYAFVDTLPPGIELVDATAITNEAGICTPAVSAGVTTITCESESGPPAEGGTHTYTFRAKSNFDLKPNNCNNLTNTVTGTTGIWTTSSAAADITIDCAIGFDLQVNPIDEGEEVVPGETIGFDIIITNTSKVDLTSATIEGILPDLPGDDEWTVTLNGSPYDFATGLADIGSEESVTIRAVSSAIPDNLQVPEAEWCLPWEASASVEANFITGDVVSHSQQGTVHVNCIGLTMDTQVSAPIIEPGGQVTYTITITNHGNAVAHGVDTGISSLPTLQFSNWRASGEGADFCEVGDTITGLTAACEFRSLAPNSSVVMTITGDAPTVPTYEQCAIVKIAGEFQYDSATAPLMQNTSEVGLTPPETRIFSEPVTTRINCLPGVEITMDSAIDLGDNNRADAGDTVTYTIEIANTGNMPLYNIVITDDMGGIEWDRDLTIDHLDTDESVTITGTYIVTQADIDSGELQHTASVVASLVPTNDDEADANMVQMFGFAQPVGDPSQIISDSVTNNALETTPLTQEPSVLLVMSSVANTGDDDELNLGDTITYTFTVTNSGNVTLTNISVVNDLAGVTFTGGNTIASLAPGTEGVLTASYTVAQTDVDAGLIETCADVTANDPNGDPVRDTDKCATETVASPIVPEPTVSPEPTTTPIPTATPTPPATPEPTAEATPTPPATPEPTAEATPTLPATPTSVATPLPTDQPETPASVSKLPETGSGNLLSFTPVLWAAAVLAVAVLGIGSMGIRRRR